MTRAGLKEIRRMIRERNEMRRGGYAPDEPHLSALDNRIRELCGVVGEHWADIGLIPTYWTVEAVGGRGELLVRMAEMMEPAPAMLHWFICNCWVMVFANADPIDLPFLKKARRRHAENCAGKLLGE